MLEGSIYKYKGMNPLRKKKRDKSFGFTCGDETSQKRNFNGDEAEKNEV